MGLVSELTTVRVIAQQHQWFRSWLSPRTRVARLTRVRFFRPDTVGGTPCAEVV